MPGRTSDGIDMEDASDEVYSYLLCSICHVSLSKPGLGYFEEDHAFHDQQQNHMVDLPDIGFLFPAFNNRSEDGKACYIIQRMPMRLNSCFWHRF